jgi:hypothetical protein
MMMGGVHLPHFFLKKMVGEELSLQMMKRLVFIVLAFVSGFSWAALAEESSGGERQFTYPDIYYRGVEYQGTHCIPIESSKDKRELYMLKTTSRSELTDGKQHDIDVAEFFSGHRYQAKLDPIADHKLSITANSLHVDLDCGFNQFTISSAPDKSHRIDARGDYLNLERISTTGRWGNLSIDSCDGGRYGRVDCDIGTNGLSRRSSDGTVRWARILVVRAKYESGHPFYDLPNALRIEDRFDEGTLLPDGTAVLTFKGVMSVRVDLVHGSLRENRPDVTMVSLDDWATLKRIMHERWNGINRPCSNIGKYDKKCEQSLIEMYFYSLQNYLFPLNQFQLHSSGVQHGKSE